MMARRILPRALLPILFAVLPAVAGAAEFDIDAGRVILRRLQYCGDCGSALLVTEVHPGVMVRCPDCGREQPRLDNRYLLTQIYQLCRLCLGPLDSRGHHPGDVVECAACHTRQALDRDAFARGGDADGLGYVPGFPPGSAKKALAFSLNVPDGPITPVPLTDVSIDLPAPGEDPAMVLIPRPPAKPASPPPPAPPIPELSPTAPIAGPPDPESSVLTAEPPAAPPAGADAVETAIAVPAVTVDLFGGPSPVAKGKGRAYAATGRVLARVNGDPVYSGEVDRITEPVMRQLRERARPEEAAQLAEREAVLRREVLDRLIDRRLAVREAALLGHKPDPAAVREREHELAPLLADTGIDLRREAERDVIMSEMRRRYAEKPGAASPEAVREFYRANKEQMIRPRLLALDQLVIYQDRGGRADARDYREIAREVSLALERGERFDDLRERYDEFAAAAGLPRAKPAMQPESAYAAGVLLSAGDLRRGAVFGPLFLEGLALYGKVVDERPEGPVPFEEVEKDIRRRLENEEAEKNLDAWLKRLRQKARVEVYE